MSERDSDRQLTSVGHLALVVGREVHVLRVRWFPVHIHGCHADFITTYIVSQPRKVGLSSIPQKNVGSKKFVFQFFIFLFLFFLQLFVASII